MAETRPDSGSINSLESPHFRPWRETAILALMVMEISWVVPWFRSLTPATYAAIPAQAFGILFCIILVSHLVTRFMNHLHLRIHVRQGVTGILLLASILFGLKTLLYPHEAVPLLELVNRPLRSFADWTTLIPDEFVITLVVLIGWWRGIALAQEHIGPNLVMNTFRFGIIMFVIYVFINTLVTGETPGLMLYTFILAALMAMSAARVSVLSTLRGGRQGAFDQRWFLGILLSALIVVVLSLMAAQIAGEQTKWLGALLLAFFGACAVLLWIVFSPVFSLFIWILRQIPGTSNAAQELGDQLGRLGMMMRELGAQVFEFLERTGIPQILSRWAPNLKAILLWSVIILCIGGVLLWAAMRLWRDRERRRLGEEQESLLGRGDLWRLLQGAVRKRLEELMGNLMLVTDLRRHQRLLAAARVRRIYVDLLELCVDLGHPRPPAHTPLEFQPILYEIFPALTGEVSVITQAYLRVRYGQLPETRQEVRDVEDAWMRLSVQGRELRTEVRRKSKDNLPG